MPAYAYIRKILKLDINSYYRFLMVDKTNISFFSAVKSIFY